MIGNSKKLNSVWHGWLGLLVIALSLTGCATAKRPVLYPNPYLEDVGQQAAERDIDECMRLAEAYGASARRQGEVAKQTTAGAAIGAATAGAWGLVRGDAAERALAGAAAGAAGGMVSGGIKSAEPDPVYKNFVQRCLSDRGYDVIGWK